jgi:uncharacterized repeat protein (TIGR01451 family)
MNLRWTLLGLAAFVGGCATPNMERIASVQSRAEALYAYGGVATFPVSSEIVEVSVYAPVHHEREYLPIPIEREKTKPVVNRQPAKAGTSVQPTKAAVSEQPTKPAVSEQSTEPRFETATKTVVTEPVQSAEADTQEQAAPNKTQESVAQIKDTPLESAEPTQVQKEIVVAAEQPSPQIDKPQVADVRQQSLAVDTRVSEKQPTFRKKVSKDRVNVGEMFAFTMEFQNSTPLDLASVQLTDPVDARLKLFPDQITVNPNYEHHVSVGNGQVIVRFAKEIKRGKKVRVTVPVMFPVTSAAAAQ